MDVRGKSMRVRLAVAVFAASLTCATQARATIYNWTCGAANIAGRVRWRRQVQPPRSPSPQSAECSMAPASSNWWILAPVSEHPKTIISCTAPRAQRCSMEAVWHSQVLSLAYFRFSSTRAGRVFVGAGIACLTASPPPCRAADRSRRRQCQAQHPFPNRPRWASSP